MFLAEKCTAKYVWSIWEINCILCPKKSLSKRDRKLVLFKKFLHSKAPSKLTDKIDILLIDIAKNYAHLVLSITNAYTVLIWGIRLSNREASIFVGVF
jgi:hypothetical protein